MRDDIIERCVKSANATVQTFGQVGHLRARPLSDDMAKAVVRAVLSSFKEATAEPSATMLAAALPMNEQPTARDKEIAAEAVTLLDTPTEWLVRSVQLGAQTSLDWRTMQAQLWQEIDI